MRTLTSLAAERSLPASLPSTSDPATLLAGLTTHTPVGIFMSDANGRCRFVNERWCELTGLSFDEALGDGWAAALHPDDRDRVAEEWAQAAGEERDSVISYRFLRPDGSLAWIEGYASAFRDGDGALVGWIGSCLDVTAHRVAEQEIRQERTLFSVAFDGAPIGMALVGLDGRFLRANAALCALLGYDASELAALRFHDVTHPDDVELDVAEVRRLLDGETSSYRLEKRYLRRDGSCFWAALSVSLIRDEDGEPLRFVSHVEDIHERKLHEQELRSEAERDPLTGLANRRSFYRELDRTVRAAAHGEPHSLILLDVDRFKQINDSLGHQAGDDALAQLAQVLTERMRETDVVARLGGDEFAVIAQTQYGDRLAEELLQSIRAHAFTLAGRRHPLTASAGVATVAGGHAEAVFERADRALYRAKNAGRDRLAAA